jgi:hypothetical protein
MENMLTTVATLSLSSFEMGNRNRNIKKTKYVIFLHLQF